VDLGIEPCPSKKKDKLKVQNCTDIKKKKGANGI
jgi:hypothetical protein